MAKLYVNPGNPKSKINKEIYGNFSEHLGRCIYEGGLRKQLWRIQVC